MIVYKDQPPISENHLCSFDRMTVKQVRKVLDKTVEVPLFLIAFLLVGGPIKWAFDDEKERDYVFGKVKEQLKEKMVRIEAF